MKIGILQCDHVSDEFVDKYGDYNSMFTSLLLKADPNLKFVIYPVIDGQFPQTLDDCDGWLITGSRHGTYDEFDWIKEMESLIRRLDREKRKVVAICFGHQLVAKTLGGKSGKSDKGWGVGLQTWDFKHKPNWMAEDGDEFSLLASHQDQISELPPGATLIAGSEFCEYGALQIGDHILTFQGHPEFTHGYSRDLMQSRTGRIPTDILEAGMASLQHEADDLKVARWMISFLSR